MHHDSDLTAANDLDSSQSAAPRRTRQRDAIHRALSDAGRPLGPGEILEYAQRDIPNLGLSTVYRNVRRLEEEGEIAPVQLPGEPPRYELSSVADHHHHHFRCEGCDRVFDIDGCPGGLSRMLPEGFILRDHTIVLRGLCAECADKERVA